MSTVVHLTAQPFLPINTAMSCARLDAGAVDGGTSMASLPSLSIVTGGYAVINHSTGQLGPLSIAGRGTHGLAAATNIGASRRLVVDINITFAPCPFGYEAFSDGESTELFMSNLHVLFVASWSAC